MSQWQPIETAPKDGTDILGWSPSDGTAIVQWAGEMNPKRWSVVHDWECYQWNHYAPTHWMPLPEPPSTP